MTLDRAKLRELCERVDDGMSAGIWYASGDSSDCPPMVFDGSGDAIVSQLADGRPYFEPEVAEFIAAARTALPELLDELEEVEKRCKAKDWYDSMRANWKNVCASEIFQELKHGKFKMIMHLLADGQISVGKAAQAITEEACCGKISSLPNIEWCESDMSWKERAEKAERELSRLKGEK